MSRRSTGKLIQCRYIAVLVDTNAVETQKGYLRAEQENLISLKKDADALLTDHPPWVLQNSFEIFPLN
jgi:hypothetical protein